MISLIVNLYFYARQYGITPDGGLENQIARGDISVLVDLTHKTNESGSVNATLFGYICNEGSRKAVIRRIELWTIIEDCLVPDTWVSYRCFFSEDLPTDLNWNDHLLDEDEARPFFVSLLYEPLGFWKKDLMLYNLTINIKEHEHSWKTVSNYSFSEHYPLQMTAIEIRISFNDGISDEEKTYTFSVS